MTERIVAPRLADIIEAIERIRRVLDGVTLEACIKIQSVEFAVASVQSGLSMAMVQRLRFRVPAIWLRQATQGRRDNCW